MDKRGWLLMSSWLLAVAVFAADQKPVQQPPPTADPALLEFLGSWQGSDGAWVDPMTFTRIDPGKLADDKTHQGAKPMLPAKEPPPRQTGYWEQSP